MEQLFKIRIAGHIESLSGDMPAKEFDIKVLALKNKLEDLLIDVLKDAELEGVRAVSVNVEAKRKYRSRW